MDGLKNMARPERLRRASCPPPYGFALLIRNSLPANLSNSFRSNSPVSISELLPNHQAGLILFGAPGEIRTPDRPVRSRVLYPAELRARCFNTVTPTQKLYPRGGANYPCETLDCQPFRTLFSHDILQLVSH